MKPEDIEREVKDFSRKLSSLFPHSAALNNQVSSLFRGYLEEKGPLFTMWVKAGDRAPSMEDADASGDVFTLDSDGVNFHSFSNIQDSHYWLPVPNIAINLFDKWFKSQQFQVDDQTKEVMRKAFAAGKTQE